jgi:hypothetical protein
MDPAFPRIHHHPDFFAVAIASNLGAVQAAINDFRVIHVG